MKSISWNEDVPSMNVMEFEHYSICPVANITFEGKYSECTDGVVFGISATVKLKEFLALYQGQKHPMSIEVAKFNLGLTDETLASCEAALTDEIIGSNQIIMKKIQSFRNLLTIEGKWGSRMNSVDNGTKTP